MFKVIGQRSRSPGQIFRRGDTPCFALPLFKNGNNPSISPVLGNCSNNPYLGVELSSTLSWDTHIGKILTKANRSLGSIRRNLGRCPTNVKRQAYLSLVRPHLDYASSVWDPHLQKHIYQIEMVQRRAARFIKHEYSRDPGIVTSIPQELELQALQERRKTSRLLVFNKITHQKVAIPLPPYLQKPTRTNRQYHPRRFVLG